MFKLRLAILGVGAALALGTAAALAAPASGDPDSHGKTVSATAHSESSVGDEHGAVVSKTASAEGQENRDGARAAAVHACQAKDPDPTEPNKLPKHASKALKAQDRKEDKAERDAIVDCITKKS